MFIYFNFFAFSACMINYLALLLNLIVTKECACKLFRSQDTMRCVNIYYAFYNILEDPLGQLFRVVGGPKYYFCASNVTGSIKLHICTKLKECIYFIPCNFFITCLLLLLWSIYPRGNPISEHGGALQKILSILCYF